MGFPGGSEGKASACNAGDLGLIPGLGRSPAEMATHSSILAWRIPWTEEPGRPDSTGSQSQTWLHCLKQTYFRFDADLQPHLYPKGVYSKHCSKVTRVSTYFSFVGVAVLFFWTMLLLICFCLYFVLEFFPWYFCWFYIFNFFWASEPLAQSYTSVLCRVCGAVSLFAGPSPAHNPSILSCQFPSITSICQSQ